MADTIITRAEAHAQGLQKYYTGEPCKRGHVAERLTSNKQCTECRAISESRPWRHDDLLAYLAKFYELTNVVSRDEAIAQGLLRYFTGKPCHRGHVSDRIVSSYQCVECSREKAAEWRAENPELARDKWREWAARNPDRRRRAERRYRDANRDLVNARLRRARAEPGPARDARLARKKEQHEANRKAEREKRKIYYDTNRDALRTKAKEYYYRDLATSRARSRRWKENNPEKYQESIKKGVARRKQYRALNRERINKKTREWQISNPDKVNAKVNVRRALKNGSLGQYTAEDAQKILIAQKHKCANCFADLRKVKRHLDHVIPLSKGGTNDRTNIQWLCKQCNLEKHAKDPIAFAQEQGRLL
jgi:5-methylcytosine-specific restriction endonuclease McrA